MNISRQRLIEEMDELDHWTQFAEHWFRCDAVYSLIRRQPPADQWIPCSERLPSESGYYEVTAEEITTDEIRCITRTFAGYLLSHNRWVTNGMHSHVVTAWREPLPEPYKGVE